MVLNCENIGGFPNSTGDGQHEPQLNYCLSGSASMQVVVGCGGWFANTTMAKSSTNPPVRIAESPPLVWFAICNSMETFIVTVVTEINFKNFLNRF